MRRRCITHILIIKFAVNTAERKIHFKVVFKQSLVEQTFIAANVIVGRGEGDIFILILPLDLVAVFTHTRNKFFLGIGIAYRKQSISAQHLFPLRPFAIAAFFFGNAKTVFPTELIGIRFHLQKPVTALMKLFSVFETDRIHNQVIVNVSGVAVRRNQNLKSRKVLGKFKSYFMRRFRC